MKFGAFYFILLILITSCSGGKGNSDLNIPFYSKSKDETENGATIPVSVTETNNLNAALAAQPSYKINDAEIEFLKKENILNEEQATQLEAIK